VPRKYNSFIDGFLRYTEGRGSPAIYRKWTAIFLVSAALERKAWIVTAKGVLYANQYIFLIGPAGVGKSLCTALSYDLLSTIRTPESPIHVAPTSVTKASLADAINKAERRIVKLNENPPITAFNSLQIIANVSSPTASTSALAHPTNITSITATGNTGREVTLKFDGILTFTDGSNLKIAGNFVTAAGGVITLFCDGTDWYEKGRSAN